MIEFRDDLTFDYVNDALRYEPSTGQLWWKVRPTYQFSNERTARQVNTRWAGKEAGCLAAGYRSIGLNFGRYRAHRLAWLLVHGVWPDNTIDHIDWIRDNNSDGNLISTPYNSRNMPRLCTNTSGANGVTKRGDRYIAWGYDHGGVQRYIGSYEKLETAAVASKHYRDELGYSHIHGQVKD